MQIVKSKMTMSAYTQADQMDAQLIIPNRTKAPRPLERVVLRPRRGRTRLLRGLPLNSPPFSARLSALLRRVAARFATEEKLVGKHVTSAAVMDGADATRRATRAENAAITRCTRQRASVLIAWFLPSRGCDGDLRQLASYRRIPAVACIMALK